MNETVTIRPHSFESRYPTGMTKSLLLKLNVSKTLKPFEFRDFMTNVTILLREPSILCVCNTEYYKNKKGNINTAFYALDSKFGVGNLRARVHNTSHRSISTTKRGEQGLDICVFAIILEPIRPLCIILQKPTARKNTEIPTVQAKHTISIDSRSEAKLLRISVQKAKWIPDSKIRECKCTTVSITVNDMDIRRVTGFEVKSASDPNIIVSETEMVKGTNVIFFKLLYPVKHGQAPDSFVILTNVAFTTWAVYLKKFNNLLLKPIYSNGFLVKPEGAIHLRSGQSINIQTEVVYLSDLCIAIFLPYLIDNVNIHVTVWYSNSKFAITLTAIGEVNLSPNTTLGEVRFLKREYIKIRMGKPNAMSVGQYDILALGPHEYSLPASDPGPQNGQGISDDDIEYDSGDDNAQNGAQNENQNGDQDDDQSDDNIADNVDVNIDNDAGNQEQPPRQINRPRRRRRQWREADDQDYSGYSAIATDPRTLMQHYSTHRHGPIPLQENMSLYRIVSRERERTRVLNVEREYEDFETDFQIKLTPLDIRILPAGLSPFLFSIPTTAFERTADPFYYTFLSRERDVVTFTNLEGTSVTNSEETVNEDTHIRPVRA